MFETLTSEIPDEHKHFAQIIFTGRVLPEFPSLDMTEPMIYFFDGYDGTKLYGSITINHSLIQAIVRTDNQDIPTIRNYVAAQSRIILDAFGYVHGYSFYVDINAVTLAGGKQVVFDTGFPALQRRPQPRPFDTLQLLSLSHDEPLRMALADVGYALQFSLETGFFCYRAVETIMQAFKTEPDDGKSWQRMHTALHTSKDYIEKRLKPQADIRRHGDVGFITSAERDQYLLSVAEIIDRYCHFISGNKVTLDQQRFPTLRP